MNTQKAAESKRRPQTQRTHARKPLTIRDAAGFIFCWATWSLLTVLVISQFLSIFWHSVTSYQHLMYGQSPVDGPYIIPGSNDEPYTDRMIVCIRQGRYYVPVQLSKALESSKARVINTNGSAVHGYRVIQRNEIDLDPDTEKFYVNTCKVIAATLVGISESCTKLGYNVANDTLRIVDGVFSNTMKELEDSLPVLIMPFWDNAIFGRSVMPGWDGNACLHRLTSKYESSSMPRALFSGIDRSLRESKTVEWLKAPGGVWKNGWYEHPSGQRWHSDVISSDQNTVYGIPQRQFDAEKSIELDCVHSSDCDGVPATENWGSKFTVTETVEWYTGIIVSNSTRYGVFIYEADHKRVVNSIYDLATFISNISVVVILVRWAVCMLSLHNSYRLGLSRWHNAGLGSLSCARSFNVLCVSLVPRLKITLAAFWTVGGEFEGQQKCLSEAWFVIYPAIADFLLFYYSLLNIVAKVFRRRVSDVMFGPTVLFFCLWHRFRAEVAQTHLFVDGRISTLVLSSEFESLTMIDLLTTDAALRMGGNVVPMFAIKLAVLALSLFPLLKSDSMTLRGKLCNKYRPCHVEHTLAIRASNVGGFGRSEVYDSVETRNQSDTGNTKGLDDAKDLACTLNSYEINRLGYLVYGRRYLISFDHWYKIASIAPFGGRAARYNHRITIHEVTEDDDGFHLSKTGELCRLDDERLAGIPFYDLQLQSALCLRTLSNHPQTRQQLSASSDTMDALLQFARQMHQELEQLQASIETTASTTEIQRHLSATVRNLCTTSVRTADIDLFRASSSPRSSSTLHSTRSLPMSTVFQATHDLMDLPVFGADEYEATTEFGWIDMLTAWTASADSQVRANAINSLVHIVEHEDSEADENVKNGLAKKELILQAWLMSMLQHLRNVSPDEELLAVREVERIAELADDLTPGNEAIQFNPAAVDAGVAALAIMAECHHEELISRGVLPLLSLLSTKGRVEEFDIHSQCARVIANLAAKCCEVVAAQYVHPPTNPADKQQSLDERHWDLMHLDIENLMRQSTSGRRFLATLKTWPKHEDPMRRSSYYRAIQNMRAYHSLVRDGHISTTVYREGIHPIVPRKHDNDIALVGDAHEEDWDVDIVFVHGLRGHPFGTWRTDMSSDIEGDNDIWPDTLLQEDLRRRHINARLITLGYEAGMMSWSSPWPSLSLEERARLMLQGLYDANIGQNNCADKPARPVIFITHSMGGLLVKKMLLQANQNLQSKSGANVSSTELVDSIRGVVFLAVPHFGSDLAKGMSSEAIRSLIRAHPALRDLCSKNRQLRDLNLAFQDLGIDCFSVAEDKPAHLALGISALVVKPTSANPGFGKFQILDDSDHMSICKAKSVDDPLYQLIAGSRGMMGLLGSSPTIVVPMQRQADADNPRPTTPKRPCNRKREPLAISDVVQFVVCWVEWSVLFVLVLSQLLSAVWHSVTTHQRLTYGQSPLQGPYVIPGTNDEPYADRMIVCMRQGRYFVPVQLNKALASTNAKVIDTNGSAVHGYRVVQRSNEIDLDPDTEAHYMNTCDVIAATLVGISDSCTKLGYHVANDTLRIVDDVFSDTMTELIDTLPVLIMPYWDNAIAARSVMPGWDGNACVHRLSGKYESSNMPTALLQGVTRSIRENKTVEWLKAPGGVWKNGWYEDPSGQRWYSDVISSNQNTVYGIPQCQFDTEKNVEQDCIHSSDCDGVPAKENWGSKFTVTETVEWYDSVAVSNGTRYGLFLYENYNTRVVDAKYDLAMFISNVSVASMLVRWVVCLLALLNSYRLGLSPWYNAGLGSLACARSFNLLALYLVPHLKITLASFWTVGAEFEGQQKALSEAWFVIYPAMAELVLFYYSLLNIVAKMLRRRMSDVLFGPTLMFFCVWHYFRIELAHLFVDGRFSTVVTSNAFESLTLLEMFTPSVAIRLCGNIQSVFVIKVVVLALNFLPLVRSDGMTVRSKLCKRYRPCQVERTLAIRASNVGGYGRSDVYDPVFVRDGSQKADGCGVKVMVDGKRLTGTLNIYEIVRLGYLVYGGCYLISFDDWYIVTALTPMRRMEIFWNHRIKIFKVTEKDTGFYLINAFELCRLNDERLAAIPFHDVSMRPLH
ncbi:TPA: hypothetical protein N0F65_007613 [Lagenidium giganteum]|uniref:Protein SERAC1 n=1 Tax=Lagenidium giganteum TaxID=4803 RepID=A0AAV2ZI03_9STRA|nr:TPA: hypothetical protein N0F65_007613 [Lagenidium giganteum]